MSKISLMASLALIAGSYSAMAQAPAAQVAIQPYRASATKVNALVHTKLDVRFDYAKRYLYGKEWATFKPYAYATDSLTLDAQGMDIKTVALVNGKTLQPLKFSYDKQEIKIQLGKKFLPGQAYTIYIAYTAKPDELTVKGSTAITDAKGLYFINPDSAVKGKPVQIWTQGETQSSSAWFPTLDRPNQKTTSEISMTVPAKYVTLSNGQLTTQVKNTDGTRTDTWKMDLPHSTYLFMMAVGNFKVYHDKWKTKEVNYYLEPAYAPYAKQIFGLTPEMIDFYSKTLGVDYPWNKYSQIVARDYVSGAMENTTATLHGEYVQRTPRQMLDENYDNPESTIAHELFHQWFGDYVTAESWSNITVNESFANYSEVLWAQHKYGKDVADDHNYRDQLSYLSRTSNYTKPLVRFNYDDKEEVFDLVSYQKGGRILNMMRNYLGDAVFFKGLNIYLKQNAFKNGEAHLLRLAMEEASGQDMNWFFNQWYFNAGHPVVNISYAWDAENKRTTVTMSQTQKGAPFIIPMAVDVYLGGTKQRHQITLKDAVQSFTFLSPTEPDLINVDADKVVLWEKADQKSLHAFNFQFAHAPLYVDRLEAMLVAAKNIQDPESFSTLITALKDPYYNIRLTTLKVLDLKDPAISRKLMPEIQRLAETDPNNSVKAEAINMLGTVVSSAYLPIFQNGLKSQSYNVQAASLTALAKQEPANAVQAAKSLEKDNKGLLTRAIRLVYANNGTLSELPYFSEGFAQKSRAEQQAALPLYLILVGKLNNTAALELAVDDAKAFGLGNRAQGMNRYASTLLNKLKETPIGKANVAYIDAAIAELK
ncbi:M1 family aminopeptidase [Pedobacter duraquae]|uniref:Aminopeptidase N n=1 Tax=Pedobacter duraquae TaxID=425511 RepID=A0A4R6IPR2_9SPHI|nr:M1 family aminopeptidase [Pedobacter duraquae]TDO23996.1 aminopeptidase N [Pedobacter duraquae]